MNIKLDKELLEEQMKLKHTPGRWNIDDANPEMVTSGECYICDCDGDFHQDLEQSEYEANARLIAAAPDMLEALIEISTMMLAGMEPVIDYDRLEKIIELATGQSIDDIMKEE